MFTPGKNQQAIMAIWQQLVNLSCENGASQATDKTAPLGSDSRNGFMFHKGPDCVCDFCKEQRALTAAADALEKLAFAKFRELACC